MTEIRIRFDLAFSRRFLSVAGAAAMMLCAVPELDSESVTLSTYYPAPSGVYTNMITTGNTFLARDSGLYTFANPNGTVLVAGGSNINSYVYGAKFFLPSGQIGIGQQNDSTPYMRFGMDTSWVQFMANNAYWDPSLGALNYKYVNRFGYGGTASRMYQVSGTLGFDTASGGTDPITWVNRMNIANNGVISMPGSLNVTGPITAGQGCTPPVSIEYPTAAGGNRSVCAGQYVTTVAGMYAKYIAIPLDRGPNMVPPVNPTANFICCPCPTGGCTL